MAPDRPNILLFITDDHGAWAAGCYGNPTVQTPRLDQLAATGTRFARAFTPTPVCSPARACLLTGRTPSQVGIHDWLQEADEEIANRDWLADEVTLFELLHGAGYQTALCGKWHLGQSHLAPRGADYHFGLPYWQGRHNGTYTYVHNGAFVELDGNKSAHITDHALAFLEQTPTEQPFFLNVGYIATHSPYSQEHHLPELTARYAAAAFDEIPPYNSHPWIKNEDSPGESPPARPLRDRYIGYYAAVTELDTNIGRILDKLAEQGRLDNTLVIYTSDHGCALGHHGFWGKGNSTRPLNMYDTSLRVPLIWRGPGITGGQVVRRCVDHYATFRTVLEMAGVVPEPERNHPGLSYGDLLRGESEVWNDNLYGEYGDLRMLRTPDWKLVWRYPHGPHDLFDLLHDPEESVNLALDAEHQPLLADLKTRLDLFYALHANPDKTGLAVKSLPRQNRDAEAWRDGRREARGLQVYS